MVLVSVAGRRTWAIARTDIRAFAVLGAVFSAIPFTLIAIAALTLPTGFGAVLNASTPLFTGLFAVAWLGQRFSARMVAGLATGVVAVVVLVGWSPLEPGLGTIIAVLAALGAGADWTSVGSGERGGVRVDGGGGRAMAKQTAASIILLPVAIASGPPGSPSLGAVVALIAVGTLSTALPWPIYFRLLSATSPTIASTVTFIVPAFAMTWGAIVLGEPIGPGLLIGFGIVIVSLVLVLGVRLPVPARWSRVPVAVRAAS
jgi:drug/metabolite transporter (DMT)-like permease